MTRGIDIRQAAADDCAGLADLIHHVLRVSNTPDYGAANVERVVSHFTPDGILDMITRNHSLVAVQGAKLVGTASLGTSPRSPEIAIRTFFVDPDLQRAGIGSALLQRIEQRARQMGLVTLPVRASIAGKAFYAARGYAPIGDHWEGDERTILMERQL